MGFALSGQIAFISLSIGLPVRKDDAVAIDRLSLVFIPTGAQVGIFAVFVTVVEVGMGKGSVVAIGRHEGLDIGVRRRIHIAVLREQGGETSLDILF